MTEIREVINEWVEHVLKELDDRLSGDDIMGEEIAQEVWDENYDSIVCNLSSFYNEIDMESEIEDIRNTLFEEAYDFDSQFD